MSDQTNSDSSDNGERVGNVRNLLIKSRDSQRELDENYAYKQKLGDLIFDASFEGANLGLVEQVDQYDFDLMVRPDVANARHRVWFNFTVSNQRPSQCVVFTFVNLSENLTLFNLGLTPVVRSRSNPNWIRLKEDQVFYYRSSNHSGRLVLSIAFRFASHDDEHQFAMFYPYSLTNLSNFIDRWLIELKRREKARASSSNQRQISFRSKSTSPNLMMYRTIRSRNAGLLFRECQPMGKKTTVHPPEDSKDFRFQVDTLATSVLSKPIYQLSVSVSSPIAPDRPKVVIIGRGIGNFESITSYICQGLVDLMLSEDPVAMVARGVFDLVAYPMLDPDSIWVGNSRSDLMGQTRIDSKTVEANPSLYRGIKLVRDNIESKLRLSNRVVLIELRADASLIGSRLVGNFYEGSLRMERHLHLPRLLARFSEGFYLEKCEFNLDQPTSCLFDFKPNSKLDQYRLEVSPFGFYKRSLKENSYEIYDQRRYLLLGKALVYALLELLRPVPLELIQQAAEVLEPFHTSPKDIDDLVLDLGEREIKI